MLVDTTINKKNCSPSTAICGPRGNQYKANNSPSTAIAVP